MAQAGRSDRRLENLLPSAGLVFVGTIRRLAAATMPGVPVSDRTAVVRIDEILRAPRVLGERAGTDVTVLLARVSGTRVEQQAVFFTTSWMYGSGLAVAEVGRMEPEGGLRRRIADAEARVAERALRERLARASLVVTGKVARTQPAEQRSRMVSEHDPDWWEAVVEVESLEKGRLPAPRMSVLFPNSTDELWIDSPKFRVGQNGIWILQKNQQERGAPVFRVPGYTALDPLDFHPREQRDRIRSLIRKRR
jgi:hypothetical protein